MKTVIFLIILAVSFGFLIKNILRLLSYLKTAQPADVFNNYSERIVNTLRVAFGQNKIMRDSVAGPLHAAIFWGFLILLVSAAEAVFEGIFSGFSFNFLGPVYSLITVVTDIFCVSIMLAVIISLIRRFVIKVPRLQGDEQEKKDAAVVLGTIFLIVCALFLQNSLLTSLFTKQWAVYPFASILAAVIKSSIPLETTVNLYEIFWWVHILAIFSFMNYLPYSKHLHVYTSIPNVFFSSLKPANSLSKIDFEKEGVEKYGVVDVEDFPWTTLLNGYSCTHCGRCTDNCPANLTGKELNPREIMVQIRERTAQKAPIMVKQKEEKLKNTEYTLTEAEQAILNKKFIGDYQSTEALWQCTSCGACMQECPVNNEHVPAIVDMRRSLVMMESEFPALLQTVFSNLENNATPWAFSAMERADWAIDTGIQTAADNPDFDILFWVGCAGSFDDRAKKISLAFAKLMQKAGVNFAILGNEEQCNGDVARRAGNEYLADMLIKGNIETLTRYNVKKIVTICPHCFNTFKNEYPMFGTNFEVVHHTQFLLELINSGKLKLKQQNGGTKINLSYHDSCYLGRYNNIYKQPRQILKQIGGINLVEAERHGDKGFCCGAGGAQLFLEETVGKRINIERTEELLATGSKSIAVNCPFCITMISDGVKAKDLVDDVSVKDIAEILLENVE